MANGKVYFPRHASWLATLEAELLQFPAGVHDDQVDALGLIGRMRTHGLRSSLGVHHCPSKAEATESAYGLCL
jgi:hypothetical protein